jgi:hypothetical protein
MAYDTPSIDDRFRISRSLNTASYSQSVDQLFKLFSSSYGINSPPKNFYRLILCYIQAFVRK